MLRTKLLILALFVAVIGIQAASAYPPAGTDVMTTSARVDLYDPVDTSILLETVFLTGRAVVQRGDPYDPGDGRMKINTLLDTLFMEGYSVTYGDSMYVTLNRTMPPANGYIQQITPGIDFPAESFFDVYYQITIGPPAPNPPKALGSVRGGFYFDQETGEGEAEFKLKAGSASNAISFTPSAPPKAPYTGPVNQVDHAKTRQGGDDMATATVIGSLPYSNTGTTAGYTDDYDEVCPYSGSTSPDVVYRYTPAADVTVTISLCNPGTDYDTKLYVYENSYTPGTPYACNDDACPNYISELPNLLLVGGNTYYIVVDGYGGNYGNYEITVNEVECILECPPGAAQEQEPCGSDANGGCNMPVPTFEPINCGDTVCGTGWADASTRDTDWYEFILTATVQITATASAEFPFVVGFVDTSDCSLASSVNPAAIGNPCDTVSATRTAGPGKYWMFVAPNVFVGYPCGTYNDYWATLTCPTQQLVLINEEPVVMADTIYNIPPNGRQYKDPRKVPVIDPTTGDTIAYVWHKHVVDPPEPDTATVPTTGTMPVVIGPNPPSPGQIPDEVVQLSGEAAVWWGEQIEGYVQTEIVSMSLTGYSELWGPAYLSLCYPAPGGAVQIGEEFFPAESFFDVCYQVDFPELGQLIILQSSPPHMEAVIEAFPPYDRKYNPNPEYHPVADAQDPSVVIGWVAPIHWVRPQVGACCDTVTGGCRETTPTDCNGPDEMFLGIGIPCTPNPCPQPPPDSNDCFESEGAGTITLDPADTNCQFGIPLSLLSILSPATKIERERPAPYVNGDSISTEIVQMELSTTDQGLGLVIVRERADKASTGYIKNIQVDGSGNLIYGESFFDVYVEVELPDLGMLLNTDDSAIHLEATISDLPPIDSVYYPLPSQPPLKLIDAVTFVHQGWLCHSMHLPTEPVPCDEPGGACCDTITDSCRIATAATCIGPNEEYKGDNTSCVPNPCITCCNTDGIRGDVNLDGALNIADLTYLVDYLFRGGPAPPCFEEGDVNGDGAINIADLTYLVDFLFRGGPPPLQCP